VAKPSEVTPMTAFLLSKICIEAGLPAGVLNIVHGLGSNVGEAINGHPDIKAISFTGSTATGRMIAKSAASTMKRVHLEMGGKNPTIIFADCDFDEIDTIENIIMLVKCKINYIIKNIHKKIPDKSYWIHNGLNVFDVNASYNFSTNEMTIPNAILQSPYIELDKGMTYNLANIGFTIAHEMVHAFDKNGCQYDDTGEIRNWWNKEDDKNYKKLQEEVVEQYETMAKRDNIKLNGKLVLSENIADISALQVIEDVLEQQLIEKDIFGPKQNSYFKELYYNYAKQWRELINKKNLNQLVMIDPHSLSKYRVNCTLIRSKRFRQIFNIQPGDNMYYGNPMNELW
jgi:predicted metalloendopeptidase